MNYESFMKESSACETVYKSKVSTLDFPGLPDFLLGSPEQATLPRAKGTLLMKAMLEKGQTNKARKHAENQTQDKKVKMVSDMSLMRQSELRTLAVDDRIRGVLQSESTSKGKGKTKMFDSQELYSYAQTTADHRRRSKLGA